MVTSELNGVKHYFLNGEWYHRQEFLCEVSKDSEESKKGVWATKRMVWKKGTITGEMGSLDECKPYEEIILNTCEQYEKLKKIRQKEIDCRELSLAITSMQDSINWLENVMSQYAPPVLK